MPQPTMRKLFLAEISTENGYRNKVWSRIFDRATNTYTFVDHEHVRRYKILDSLGDMLDLMTDAEVNFFFERVERKRAEKPPEPLF